MTAALFPPSYWEFFLVENKLLCVVNKSVTFELRA